MGILKLTCLGTGDGRVSVDRGHSAFLYELAGATLLMDCGEPVSRRLKAAGVKADDLDCIFLSHLHCDHSGGLFMLMQGLWLDQRRRNLMLHLPAEGIEPIRNMLRGFAQVSAAGDAGHGHRLEVASRLTRQT